MKKLFKNNSLVIGLVIGLALAGGAGVMAFDVPQKVFNIQNYFEAQSADEGMVGGVVFEKEIFVGEVEMQDTLSVAGDMTFVGDMSLTGVLEIDGVLIEGSGKSYSTSSIVDHTFTQSDLETYQYWDIVNMTDATDLSFTMPATATMIALLPEVGSTRTWYLHNATTTGDDTIDLTLVTGAGMEMVGIDANVDVIAAEEWLEVKCIHKAYINSIDENIVCLLEEMIAVD